MTKNVKLHFRRFEFKYLLPANVADLLIPQLLSYMSYDPYALEKGYYDVNSIYFDTPNLALYQEKVDGVDPRKKFRLRYYGYDPDITDTDSTVFFEIKRRFDATIIKDREIIQIPNFYSDNWRDDLLQIASSNGVLEEAYSTMLLGNMKQQIAVSYRRVPFVAQYDSQVRVTLDTQVRAQNWSDFLAKNNHWYHLYPHLVVLELKCNNTIPDWFQDIVHRYSLSRISYSKFALSLNETRNLGDVYTLE